MYLQLSHTKLNAFEIIRQFVNESYKMTPHFPNEEKYAMAQQLRRAALSVYLNFAEGSSRFSKIEKCRFYEISRSSLVEVDTILDIASDQKYITKDTSDNYGELIVNCFKYLSALIKATKQIPTP